LLCVNAVPQEQALSSAWQQQAPDMHTLRRSVRLHSVALFL